MFQPPKRLTLAAALAVSIAAPASAQEGFINVLTGGTSGVYYPLGVALSQVYGEKIEGAKAQVQATKASVENLNLLQQGRGEIAFTLGDSLKLAWEGDTDAGFPGNSTSSAASPPSIRTMFRSLPRRSPASRRSPTSRAGACRSARRSPGPSSMPAPSLAPPA